MPTGYRTGFQVKEVAIPLGLLLNGLNTLLALILGITAVWMIVKGLTG